MLKSSSDLLADIQSVEQNVPSYIYAKWHNP